MELISSAFDNNGFIPKKYWKDGQNISPPLSWSGEPQNTKSFALSMIDIDSYNFIHWEILNIPLDAHLIEENASRSLGLPGDAAELANSSGGLGYYGPKPPIGSGPHRYVFSIYALSIKRFEPFSDGPLLDLVGNKIITVARLTAISERKAKAA